MNKYHSYAPGGIQNNFLFSSGRKPLHQGFFHAEALDATHYPLMRLRDRPQRSAHSNRKRQSLTFIIFWCCEIPQVSGTPEGDFAGLHPPGQPGMIQRRGVSQNDPRLEFKTLNLAKNLLSTC